MKKNIIVLLLIIVSLSIKAQETFEKFIEVGIANHDEGKYEEAIKYYKKALKLKPDSELVNYEISLSYFNLKDYKNTIKYCDKVLKKGSKHALPAYINKGSSLDMLGKTKKSIKVFEKAISKLGDHYLLHFNLAINYLKINKYDTAENHLKKGIKNNPFHDSSHYYLAKINNAKNNRVPTLLASYYFLLIDPESIRAQEIYEILKLNLSKGVKKDKNGKDIRINLNPNIDGEFGAVDMMISMLEASKNLEENKKKSKEDLFEENTKSFFTILEELKENKKESIWWDFYVPFFYKIVKSEHFDTYCKFITQMDMKSKSWLDNNEEKLNAFFEWIKKEFEKSK